MFLMEKCVCVCVVCVRMNELPSSTPVIIYTSSMAPCFYIVCLLINFFWTKTTLGYC